MKIKQFEFKKEIKKVSVKPRQKWVFEVKENLENVTNVDGERISFYGLFNFLSLIQMNKPLKLTLTAFATATALGVIGVMTAGAVNASVPGDFLYGLDRAYETLGSTMQFSDTAKTEYQIDLLEERAAEAVLLEKEGNEELLEEALENLEDAEEATLERIRNAEDNENSDDGELERLRERLEKELEEAVKVKEQLKEMYEQQGNKEAAEKVEASIEQLKKEAEEYRDSSEINFIESGDDFDEEDEEDEDKPENQDDDTEGEEESENNSEDHDGDGSYTEQEQNGEDNSEDNSDGSGQEEDDEDHGNESRDEDEEEDDEIED